MNKMIQIRNVPPHAAPDAEAGMTLSDYLLRELERLAERPPPQLLRERILSRDQAMMGESAAEAVRAERESR